jgi:hypothetical protein
MEQGSFHIWMSSFPLLLRKQTSSTKVAKDPNDLPLCAIGFAATAEICQVVLLADLSGFITFERIRKS